MNGFITIQHKTDICVVGGGMSGICAAIAAARKGKSVVIMQERPVWGGNASSEIRMWICGAGSPNARESGILEEIALDSIYRNPYRVWPCWDGVLFGKIKDEKNITPLLNCSCFDGETENGRIVSITGWQMTTQTFHKIEAEIFIDCSGDSVLGPISGAEYRTGREAASEYGEAIGRTEADTQTMGSTCILQARETNGKRNFIPPTFALKNDAAFAKRTGSPNNWFENYWYLELGGNGNTIADAEQNRDDLVSLAYGEWDYVKRTQKDVENWEIDFVSYLPAKRESRRYVGDVTVRQQDLEEGHVYEDEIAFGGWPMDDHLTDGFYAEVANRNYAVSIPYGIPYRAIYSKNVENLLFAGRNISVSHLALSSTRVMATCAVLGQAAGTAAAIAVENGLTPRGVYEKALDELQQTLIYDDCYLPFVKQTIPETMKNAVISGNIGHSERLVNGIDRDFFDNDGNKTEDNGAQGKIGCKFRIDLENGKTASEIRLVFDSELWRGMRKGDDARRRYSSRSNVSADNYRDEMPESLVKSFTVKAITADGQETELFFENNLRRLVIEKLPPDTVAAEITLHETWGSPEARIMSAMLILKP